MTVNDIKSMLDRYYGGYTTEAEEKALLDYFSQNEVDEELLPDKELFMQLAAVKVPDGLEQRLCDMIDEQAAKSSGDVIGRRLRKSLTWVSAAAACALIVFGATTYNNTVPAEPQSEMTPEEAYAHTKMALTLLSTNLQKGMAGIETAEKTTCDATELLYEELNKI